MSNKQVGGRGSKLGAKQPRVINGQQIDVRATASAPDRPTVVLIHGIGVSGNYFIPLAELLAAAYRVYVLDLPGYGTTPKPDRALSVDELATIVTAFIEDANLSHVTLIGHSMGCQIATHVARQSGRIGKLILLAPTVNSKERRAYWQLLRLLQDSFHEPAAVNLLMLADYLAFGIRQYLQTTRYMLKDKLEYYGTMCLQPTLILRGSKDVIVPKAWVHQLAQIFPNVQSSEVAQQPHAFHYSDTQTTAALCRAFIEASDHE